MLYGHVREVNRAVEIVYSHGLSGKLAEKRLPHIVEAIMQNNRPDVFWNTSFNSFMGPVQLYSEKYMVTLAANSLTFYPLHVTLLNFRNEFRCALIQGGETKVAFLPVYMYHSK